MTAPIASTAADHTTLRGQVFATSSPSTSVPPSLSASPSPSSPSTSSPSSPSFSSSLIGSNDVSRSQSTSLFKEDYRPTLMSGDTSASTSRTSTAPTSMATSSASSIHEEALDEKSTAPRPPSPSLVHWEETEHPGVYAVVLSRPKEHNALSKKLLSDFEDVLDELARPGSTPDPIKAVVIRSSEKGKFCAGADLKERRTMSEDEVVAFLGKLRRTFDKVAAFRSPIIAALDGPTLGGGLELAIACDFRVANCKVARIGFPETCLGIIPGAGGTQRAPRLLGLTKAKELIFTGRLLTAQEAYDWGLVDYLSDEGEDAFARALRLAALMADSAPLALSAAKLAISKGLDMELDNALQWEVQCYEKLLPTKDRVEALEAFAQKRKPSFIGE